MKKLCLNDNWFFHIEDEDYKKTGDIALLDERSSYGVQKTGYASGFAARKYEYCNWRKVDLPHDYAVELPLDYRFNASTGTRPISDMSCLVESEKLRIVDGESFPIAWYRKTFFVDEDGRVLQDVPEVFEDAQTPPKENQRFFLEFEGVFRDYILWVNGVYIDRHFSGYTGHIFDITDQIIFGETNTIAVRVDCSQYEGWWYDGAGIYRNVNLYQSSDIYCLEEDLYIEAFTDGNVNVNAVINNMTGIETNSEIRLAIKKDGLLWAESEMSVPLACEENSCEFSLHIDNPDLWDVDNPNLYVLELCIGKEKELEVEFGFKEIQFSSEKGFFLNGRSLKINGVCLHQDFVGVGIAMTDAMVMYRLQLMKEMGVNAIRCVHHPASKAVMGACDRLGLMVMNETRQFGSSPEALRQLRSIVKRDRNHVSIILWSLGNEEVIQNNMLGRRMAETVIREIRKLTRNAYITYAANNGAMYQGVNERMDVRGINYIRIGSNEAIGYAPDLYHKEHKDQPLFCSEEASSLTVRGIYKDDVQKGYLDSYGENTFSWGSTPEGYLKYCMNREFFCGGFIWTGFDYRGEPSPFTAFREDGTRNVSSSFGIFDLCGFPKDAYYYYKAWWGSEPVLHLLPHWNFTEGETVRVVAYTNCDRVTLYLNGKEIGSVTPEKYGSPEWLVAYEPGILTAIGTKNGKEITCVRKTQVMAGIDIKTQKVGSQVFADVLAVCEDKSLYPLACDMVCVEIEGGEVIGAGNGDPTSVNRECFYKEVWKKTIKNLQPNKELLGERIKPRDSRWAADVMFVEKRNSMWENTYRKIWEGPKEVLEEYVFTSKFLADDSFEFLEFQEFSGAAEVFLNGVFLGAAEDLYGTIFVSRRPYRFYGQFVNGLNTLEVKMRVKKGYLPEIVNPEIGKYISPKIQYPLFQGMLRLIVKAEEDCKIFVETDQGYKAEVQI